MKSSTRQVQAWLYIGCAMVFIMIIIGGITRLTGSGLSMTEWNVVMGSIPPLNNNEWELAFNKYKQFPQYNIVNQEMNLHGFKEIFFWEYFHRLWGRIIGVVFIIPFLYFLFRKKFEKTTPIQLIGLFLLGGLQGLVGWYMVKSGLVDKPWVSHYRLAIHLLLALTVYSYTLYLGFNLKHFKYKIKNTPSSRIALLLSNLSIVLLFLQIFYGALMAGLKAGVNFPTYPKMNGEWIPNEIFDLDGVIYNLTSNRAMVQLLHRSMPILLGVLLIWLIIHIKKNKKTLFSKSLSFYLTSSFIVYLVQFILGILTVINCQGKVPVGYGVIHQATAIILLTFILLTNFRLRKGLSR